MPLTSLSVVLDEPGSLYAWGPRVVGAAHSPLARGIAAARWCPRGEPHACVLTGHAGHGDKSDWPLGPYAFNTLLPPRRLDHADLASSSGSEKWKLAPAGALSVAQICPPCASMIDFEIARPMPTPEGLVV